MSRNRSLLAATLLFALLVPVTGCPAPDAPKPTTDWGPGASTPGKDTKNEAVESPTATAAPTGAAPAGGVAATPSADAEAERIAKFEQEMRDKYGTCEVDVTGAVTKKIVAGGGMSALGSDYFMNDEEMTKAIEFFKGNDTIEVAMKRDPRIYTLIVNCVGSGVNLNFLPSNDTKYADVPFGPKKYTMGKSFGSKPGVMTAMLSIDNAFFNVVDGGTFDVTKFDKTGLAGTFEFKAKGDAGEITVKGTVDYRCAHDTALCREGRGG